jgi:UDP-glucose/iron transport system permease protein
MVVGLVALPRHDDRPDPRGSSPNLAVRYQIMVAFMLAGAVAVTSTAMVLWYRRRFFNSAEQLAIRIEV